MRHAEPTARMRPSGAYSISDRALGARASPSRCRAPRWRLLRRRRVRETAALIRGLGLGRGDRATRGTSANSAPAASRYTAARAARTACSRGGSGRPQKQQLAVGHSRVRKGGAAGERPEREHAVGAARHSSPSSGRSHAPRRSRSGPRRRARARAGSCPCGLAERRADEQRVVARVPRGETTAVLGGAAGSSPGSARSPRAARRRHGGQLAQVDGRDAVARRDLVAHAVRVVAWSPRAGPRAARTGPRPRRGRPCRPSRARGGARRDRGEASRGGRSRGPRIEPLLAPCLVST